MKPASHVVTSGVVSIFVGFFFHSIGCALVTLSAGVLIDIDHLLDYFYSHGFTASPVAVYDACENHTLKRLFLIFHSYELLIIMWAGIIAFHPANVWIALAIGMTQHLVFDQFTNPLRAMAYFASYRAYKNFDAKLIFRQT